MIYNNKPIGVDLPNSPDTGKCQEEIRKWLVYYISSVVFNRHTETIRKYLKYLEGKDIKNINIGQGRKDDILFSFITKFCERDFYKYFYSYKGNFKANENSFAKDIIEKFNQFKKRYDKEHKRISIKEKDTVSYDETINKNNNSNNDSQTRQDNYNAFNQSQAEKDDDTDNQNINENDFEDNDRIISQQSDLEAENKVSINFVLDEVIKELDNLKKKELKYQFFALIISHNRWLKYVASLQPWAIQRIRADAGKKIKELIKNSRTERPYLNKPKNPNKKYYTHRFEVEYDDKYKILTKNEQYVDVFYENICRLLEEEGYSFRDRLEEEKTYNKLLKKYFAKKQLSKVKRTIANKLSKILFSIFKYEVPRKNIEKEFNNMQLCKKLKPLPSEVYSNRDSSIITTDLKFCKNYKNELLLYAAIKYYDFTILPDSLLSIKEHLEYCQNCNKYIKQIIKLLEYRKKHKIKEPYIQHQPNINEKFEYSKIFKKEELNKDDIAYYYLLEEEKRP